MNRIDETFSNLKKEGRKALISFITAGDPDFDTTEKLVLAMADAGVDIVELGVPFSDPIAEGPVIQAASLRSLEGGTTMEGIFSLAGRLREKVKIPILLMLYVNSIFRFGKERFFSLCAQNGIDGVIVPDLPYEEQGEIKEEAEAMGIIPIQLVAPTSGERIDAIAAGSHGFLYCVSSTGVTGTRASFQTDFDAFFGAIKKSAAVPCAVGFGISTPEQAKQMASYCDGVIVGSAIVKIVGEYGREAAPEVSRFTASLRSALDS